MPRDPMRIGCASGFWGDSLDGAEQLVRRGDVDVLVFDYLAEITMALLARARARSPDRGYVPDFIEAVAPVLPEIRRRGIRVVTNAGGVDPRAAAAALARRAAAAAVALDIAVVTGDDLTGRAGEFCAREIRDMFSGAPVPDQLMSANAYLGAQPIAAALDRGADVVITGRAVDSALTLGALVHAFGWSWTDYDRLAQGSLAGHLIECAAQATGGLFTDWRRVPGWDDMGLPIVECAPDGGFVLTKPAGTGGLVTGLAVAEQMLYEIGDPSAYVLPDVVCDFRDVTLSDAGPDRVCVAGARGRPPTETLKVSATAHDGYRVIGTVTIGGREAADKAQRVGEAVIARARRLAGRRGLEDFSETSIEVLGAESTYGPHARAEMRAGREVVLKIAARHPDAAALEILAREIIPAASSMAQGLTGFFAGRPSVQPVIRLSSFLWPKADVAPLLHIAGETIAVPFGPSAPLVETAVGAPGGPAPAAASRPDATVPLIALAVGRSGDKGNAANIGVIARRPEYLPFIRASLTADAVAAWFAHTGVSRVERFELPGIGALNFVLHDALGGGGVASLRIDPQGKAFAQMLMDHPVAVPQCLADRAGADAAPRVVPAQAGTDTPQPIERTRRMGPRLLRGDDHEGNVRDISRSSTGGHGRRQDECMPRLDDDTTIGDAFFRAAEAHAGRPFLAVPKNPERRYHPGGFEIDYAAAAREVGRLTGIYRAAGFGHGHRVAMLLENRPEHLLHKLALNAAGASCVPINPDYRAAEIAYLLENSRADAALVTADRAAQLEAGMPAGPHRVPTAVLEEFGSGPARPARAPLGAPVEAATEASILYTSGTTGRPKGCVLSHGYELAAGARYATAGGLAAIREGEERLYNPLPLYHVNASVVSFLCMMLTGNCQIQPDRFHPQRWWSEIRETRATIVHYLGVIVPMLLGRPPDPADRRHHVRFGIGAGVEPQLHAAFEERFGFPLIEVWGMTEMVRVLIDNVAPRQVGTRAFGRSVEGIEVRVVDDADHDRPDGTPGEMIIRHSAATPRKLFFSGYLGDPAATEQAWRGGWFHTGDTVWRGADGMLHFVDRKKNIIRRSGENIAAAEVEALLLTHDDVRQAAVIAVADELREEEVFACVVLDRGAADAATAEALFRYCHQRLAYFKAPGWIHFAEALPTTGTQKIQKHQIFAAGTDPRTLPGTFDLRRLKQRDRA